MIARPTIATHMRMIAVGSRVTCNPPPTNTDRDWLVLVAPAGIDPFLDEMFNLGWSADGSFIPPERDTAPADERFYSLKLGEENVIATESAVFFRRFLAASSVAQRLNLMVKADRVALFQAVLYGNGYLQPAMPDEMRELFEQFAGSAT